MLTFYWDNLCSNLAEVYIVILENCLKRTKIQEDEARDGPFKKYLTLISFFFKNGPFMASFSFIFVFSNKHYNSYNKYMWKMLCTSSIWCRDSNP